MLMHLVDQLVFVNETLVLGRKPSLVIFVDADDDKPTKPVRHGGEVLGNATGNDLLVVQLSVLHDLLIAEIHHVLETYGVDVLGKQVHRYSPTDWPYLCRRRSSTSARPGKPTANMRTARRAGQ